MESQVSKVIPLSKRPKYKCLPRHFEQIRLNSFKCIICVTDQTKFVQMYNLVTGNVNIYRLTHSFV